MEIANSIIAVLKQSAIMFRKHGVQYCLAGGLAVSMLTRPRATEDVDLIILVEESEKNYLEGLLRQELDVIQSQEVMHFKNASIWRNIVSFQSEAVVLDLIFADKPAYRNAVTNAETLELDGVTISIVTPQDLIEVKKLSARPMDISDIELLREVFDNES